MVCSVLHCDKAVFARGWCANHYRAWRVYGDPTKVVQKQVHGKSLRERFFHYTKQSAGCWEWAGSKDANGYGRLNVGGKPILASRASFLLHHGDVPAGKCVCHKCDNPGCVNPEHLFIGTQAENVADMHTKGRARKRGLPGVTHHAAKMTPEAVREIRAGGKSDAHWATHFGVSRATVHAIRTGKTWAHID